MSGLLILLICLLLGEFVQELFLLPVPASIAGMLLLLCVLTVRGKTPKALESVSTQLSPLLPLFLIPVSVGVVTQKAMLLEHGLVLLLILALSLIPGALVTAWIMNAGQKDTGSDS